MLHRERPNLSLRQRNLPTRRYTLPAIFLPAVLALSLISCGQKTAANSNTIRIGYQKWSTFSILKTSGKLGDAFKSKGINVEWIEFSAGPPLFEALNAGSIDLGHSGDSPPLFAQAANIPFVYFGASSSSPESTAILLRPGANIHSATDLRGHRVGFAKGTSAHTLVLRYLDKNGLSFSDITSVYLSPADGRAALDSGAIDAWAIWDPYLAAAQEGGGGYRTLTSGKGYVDGREFYFASRSFADRQPQQIKDFLTELERIKGWAKANSNEVNHFLSTETGIPLPAVALAESRRNRYETQPMSTPLIEAQQSLADRYFAIGLLPKQIAVSAALLDEAHERSN
jgi:sulfonate transport system substrate-binding protein